MAVIQKIRMSKIDLSYAPWTMHEFFAGSGLVAYGLKGMFRPVWANDVSDKKASVYRANFDGRHFVLGDIKDVRGADLPYAHLSWASFPCQDLSLAGSIGGIGAARSGLGWEWLRVLREMPQLPRILVAENVPGLLSADKGRHFVKLHDALSGLGYRCGAVLIDAARFVPQSRPRVFVIAVLGDVAIPSELTGAGPNWLHNKAAADLGKDLHGWVWWRANLPPERSAQLADVIDFSIPYDKDGALRLIASRHREMLDGMESAVVTGYRRTRGGRQCMELRFDGVAGCLRTPEGGSSKQFLVVKRDGRLHARLLAPREAARLMGVPDSFALPGTANDGYKAMGDAVALPVARFLGESFLTKLAEAAYGTPNFLLKTRQTSYRKRAKLPISIDAPPAASYNGMIGDALANGGTRLTGKWAGAPRRGARGA
jgi:DNA (cytosine-5)-methyltransferase 1